MNGSSTPERRSNDNVDDNLYAAPGNPLQGGLP